MLNKQHLKKSIIHKYKNELYQKGYCIIDDFLDPLFYEAFEKELNIQKYTVQKTHTHLSKVAKDIYIVWEKSYMVHNFFQSETFLKYLSLIYTCKTERKNYVDFCTAFPQHAKTGWLVGQMYDAGCFFDWHTDWKTGDNSLWAFTYYLYNSVENWDISLWWCLELKDGISIVPHQNRLVLLKSWIVHRVSYISWSEARISIQSTLTQETHKYNY